MTLKITRYNITTSRFTGGPLRIVHLSDLHNTVYGENQQELIGAVRGEYPDIIVCTGDIFDNRRSQGAALLTLRGVRKLAPVYFVTGNHEYDMGVYERLRGWLERLDICFLDNSQITREIKGKQITLAGLADPLRKYDQRAVMERRFKNLAERDSFRVLLTHRPERIGDYLRYPFDLILAGHTHGGQVRVPFTNQGLYARHQGILPPYARGIYHFGARRMIVNCGLSKFAAIPRIFNPPEIVSVII